MGLVGSFGAACSVRGLDCAFTCAITRSGGSRSSLYTFPARGLARRCQSGSADFENMHTRRFRRGVRRTARVRRVANYTKGQCSSGCLHSSNRSIAIRDSDLVYLIQRRTTGHLQFRTPLRIVPQRFASA